MSDFANSSGSVPRTSSAKSVNAKKPAAAVVTVHEQLRIALIRQKFRFDGGGERIVAGISQILRQHGHAVTLIARRWEGAPVSENVLACDPGYWTRVQRESRFAREALALAGKHQFDLVQSHERIPGVQVYRAGDGVHQRWLELRSRQMSGWRRGLLYRNSYHRYTLQAEREMFEHSGLRRVICNASMIADEIADRFRIDPSKLKVIYNGVDTNRFHPAAADNRDAIRAQHHIPAGQTLGLFVGSGWERKGLALAMQAIRPFSQVSLLVVGRDKSQKQFQRLAGQLGVTDRVVFAGVQRDVVPYYGAADFYLLPTLYDPFPNSIMEAMACGLPVITSTTCGAAEILQTGRNGAVVEGTAADDWSTAVDLCVTPDACRLMGHAARQTILPFTPEAMQQRLTDLYSELLGTRAAAA